MPFFWSFLKKSPPFDHSPHKGVTGFPVNLMNNLELCLKIDWAEIFA